MAETGIGGVALGKRNGLTDLAEGEIEKPLWAGENEGGFVNYGSAGLADWQKKDLTKILRLIRIASNINQSKEE